MATVRKFLEEGANVVLIDIDEKEIKDASRELRKYETELRYFVGDITDKNSITASVSYIIEQFGSIDILVNNAGITADAQLLKMEEEQWDQVINVNLKGVFLISQIVAEHMKERETGVILNASSVVGLYGNFGQTNYAATKFGINGMTKTWARELGKYNIRVNSVAPGFILTEMTKKMPEKVFKMMKDKSVLRTLGNQKM